MLLNFSVENFASIGKRQSINLITGKARGKSNHLLKAYKQSVLKFTSIYGGNAAGKSTIIKAMHFGKKMILNGYLDKRFMSVNRSSEVWNEKPTEFIYTIFINKKIYEYGFTLSWHDERVIKEWLIEKNSRLKQRLLFIRDFTKKHFEFNIKAKNSDIDKRLSIYFSDASNEKNILFLNEINSKKGNLFESDPSLQYLKLLYRWFLTKMKFVYPNSNSDLGTYSFLNYPENNNKLYDCLLQLDIPISKMSYIDISIEQAFKDVPDSVVEEIETDFKEMYQHKENQGGKSISVVMRLGDNYYIIEANGDGIQNIKTVQFTHGKYGQYEFKEESDGTKRILELLEMITSPEQDVTYIVDEIDRSLHPLLTEQLISMYLNPERPNFNQLIITTHESRLLNLSKLRKDEIYFVTNRNGESEFVRLDEFENKESRSDLNIELAYLNGRYNGVPTIIKYEDN
jgi:AAA15 family ATPase/GTPase